MVNTVRRDPAGFLWAAQEMMMFALELRRRRGIKVRIEMTPNYDEVGVVCLWIFNARDERILEHFHRGDDPWDDHFCGVFLEVGATWDDTLRCLRGLMDGSLSLDEVEQIVKARVERRKELRGEENHGI